MKKEKNLTVKVKTRPYGEIEVDDRQIVDFPEGILGFDDEKKFVMLDTDDENSPFKWLQSYREPDLVFIIIQPIDFMTEYELVISQSDINAVRAESANELLVFAIVTIPNDPNEMTANLQGPIIINPKTRLGKQAISLSDKYVVKHKIMDEIKNASVAGS